MNQQQLFAEDGFGAVVDTFRENFDQRGEVGAGFCVMQDGKVVVDLAGGIADPKTQRPWTRDTLAVVFSATKGWVALAFLMLEDRGLVDLDMPVASYWPSFARNGKSRITLRQLLNHRAGLSAIDQRLTLDDFQFFAPADQAVENQRPMWNPGSKQAYSATSFGVWAQPIFRRLTGETVGSFIRREIAEPLGADIHLGLAEDEFDRVATLLPATPKDLLTKHLRNAATNRGSDGQVVRRVLQGKRSITGRAFLNPVLGRAGLKQMNNYRPLSWEMPWFNGVATARGLATLYAPLAADGASGTTRLVAPRSIKPLATRQTWAEVDGTLRKPMGFSQGFVKEETHLFSPNPASFGHPGMGGSLGWADPDTGLSIGYTLNRMDHRIRSPRAIALCHALYKSLGR